MKTNFLLSLLLLFSYTVWSQTGNLDKSFGSNGITTTKFNGGAFLNATAIQTDGKIIAAGTANGDFALTRYTINGALDSSFGNNGKVTTNAGHDDIAMSVTIQPNGKIIAAGYTQFIVNGFEESDFALVRYNTNGTLDSSFGTNGIVIYNYDKEDFANSVILQADNKIIVAGTTDDLGYSDAIVLRFKTDGSLDKTFGVNGKFITGYDTFVNSYNVIKQVALDADGKIVLTGVTQADVAGLPQNDILIKLNADGSFDNNFGDGGKAEFLPAGIWAYSLSIQQDGKIVLAGFDFNNNDKYAVLARYNSNGTIDDTYGNDGVVYVKGFKYNHASEMRSVVLQPDGKIVAAGFTFESDLTIVRYTSTGAPDSSFGSNGVKGFSNAKLSSNDGEPTSPLAMQQDNKIIVATVYDNSFSLSRLLNNINADKSSAINNKLSIRIYPNPAVNNLFVDGLNKALPAVITIADISGNIIKTEKLNGINVIDISKLKTGRYIVTILQDNKTASAKFVKQ